MTKKLTSVFERTGRLAAALTVCLSLAHVLTLQPAGSARAPRPETSAHVAKEAAQVTSTGQKRTLRPITAGMRRPTQTADRGDMQLAAFNPAAIAIAPPRDRFTPLNDVVIDVVVAYTKAAARSYRDIVAEVIEPAIAGGNESFRMSGIGHIKLRLVHAYQTAYVEAGDQFVHLWRFADNADGYMDGIHDLRDHYQADVAVLIVDDADGCGQATRVGADEDEAFLQWRAR